MAITVPAGLLLLLGLILALSVNHSSAKKDEDKTKKDIENSDEKPEHVWVSGEASPGAWVFGVVTIIAAVLIASHL